MPSASHTYYDLFWNPYGVGGTAVNMASSPATWRYLLPGPSVASEWVIPDLELVMGTLVDYLSNDMALCLCSEKLRDIMEKHRSPEDNLEWLPAKVYDKGKVHPYFVLHILEELDVVDTTLSMMDSSGDVLIPVICREKVGDHQVFRYKGAGMAPRVVCISNKVRLAIKKAKCVGCALARIAHV
jgi:hypothetical protein